MKKQKKCTRCKETKNYDQFYKSGRSKDGYTYQCKECTSIKLYQYKANIKDKSLHGLRDAIITASKQSDKDLQYILDQLSHATLSNQHTVEDLDALKDLAERRLGL